MSDKLRPTAVFWYIIAVGFLLSPMIAISVGVAKGASAPAASREWFDHLFLAGHNEFALCLIGATPFVITALFSRFHLTRGAKLGEMALRKRFAGVAGAVLAGAAFSIWVMAGIRTSRSSTAAIAYLFLPFYVSLVIPIGYLAGRVVAKCRGNGPA